jgi:hypothetical protein
VLQPDRHARGRLAQGTESAVEVAVREGAVAVNVPDDGVKV